jgi:hypothetical protein
MRVIQKDTQRQLDELIQQVTKEKVFEKSPALESQVLPKIMDLGTRQCNLEKTDLGVLKGTSAARIEGFLNRFSKNKTVAGLLSSANRDFLRPDGRLKPDAVLQGDNVRISLYFNPQDRHFTAVAESGGAGKMSTSYVGNTQAARVLALNGVKRKDVQQALDENIKTTIKQIGQKIGQS